MATTLALIGRLPARAAMRRAPMLPPCRCNASRPSHTATFLLLRRTYATQDRRPLDPDPSLSSAAREAASRSSYRNSPGAGPHLGPFSMPRGSEGERPLGEEEGRRWGEAGWGERVKRVVRGARNGVVIAFGGTLGVLVVYSIVSELAGSTSPTNLMSSLSAHLSSSPSLQTILYPPLTFHGGPSSNSSPSASSTKLRRHRGPTQSIETDPMTGRELMRVRFWVEGGPDPKSKEARQRGWTDPQYWRELPRRLVGPLITSEPPPPPTPPPPTPEELAERAAREKREKGSVVGTWTGWVTGVFGSLMPKTLARKKQEEGSGERGWFERKPALGRYRSGEVTAELVRDQRGTWTYRAFCVDFPDAWSSHYRLDVLDELRSSQAASRTAAKEEGWTRYRFWNRKVPAA